MNEVEKGFRERLFPAQAGVIPALQVAAVFRCAVPRASGGDPLGLMDRWEDKDCSPRKRG